MKMPSDQWHGALLIIITMILKENTPCCESSHSQRPPPGLLMRATFWLPCGSSPFDVCSALLTAMLYLGLCQVWFIMCDGMMNLNRVRTSQLNNKLSLLKFTEQDLHCPVPLHSGVNDYIHNCMKSFLHYNYRE